MLLLALTVVLVGVGLTVVLTRGGDDDTPPTPDPRPNVVVIMTDDLSLAELRYLPQTEALLGDAGVTFTQFLSPQPLCCPARAQFLTGQYAQNNGVRHNEGPFGGYPRFHPDTALPVWLQDAGYRTAMVGKYLNEYDLDTAEAQGPEVGWTHWDPTVKRIYDYVGFTQYDDGRAVRPGVYHTDYVTQRSEELVDELSGDTPFFLWTSYVAPHGVCRYTAEAGGCDHPPRPAPRYLGTRAGERGLTLDLPSFNEADLSDKPGFLRGRPFVPTGYAQEVQERRAEALASVDDGVAGIVEALRRSGELEDTYLLFTSDNGYLVGQHRWVGKVLAYEESVRVPLLIRGPGLPAGLRDDQPSAMIDLAPTIAVLARATPQVDVDGDVLVVRRSPPPGGPPDRTVLVQAGASNLDRYPTGWWFRGVRTNRYTYVYYTRGGFEELYDRDRDRYQLRNAAGEPRYAEVLAELRRRTTVLGSCAGPGCRRQFARLPGPVGRSRPD